MKSASGKRPPDEAHGPGIEAIRPQQRCLGKSRKESARARCSPSGSRDYADSKDKACDARHGARVVQIARCSASTSKNCKISFFILFRESLRTRNFQFQERQPAAAPAAGRTLGNVLGTSWSICWTCGAGERLFLLFSFFSSEKN